ncbi:unnamed protein product [Strongylus vulgaris]|uniref:Major facilitator superfamily (MFS) profile domain-containing protein n=1 Tax=Strongylus vulgaris TaxID=40348 RepID=A0A3P7J9V5_STRVU|nr:unnamed protein product [Strongylus vulgaris]
MLRTVLGFFTGGLLGTYVVYKMEHIPKRHRLWVMAVIAFAPNFILLNGIAYLSHDWRTFQRVLFFISSPAFVHESPRWLIQKGRIEEARKVLQRIQRIDKQKAAKKDEMEKMLDAAYQKMQEQEKKLKNYNVRHLFYTKEMTLATTTYCAGLIKSLGRKAVHFMSQSTIAFCLFVVAVVHLFGKFCLEEQYGIVIRIATITAASVAAQVRFDELM